MSKSEIKIKVKKAYLQAKEYPAFMDHFKPAIQHVIDDYVPSDFTKSWHVNADIEHLAEVSKANGYNTGKFLSLITEYILMIIKSFEKGETKLSNLDQSDLFESNKNND